MNTLFMILYQDLKNNPFILNLITKIQKNPFININILYEKYGNNIQNINILEESMMIHAHETIIIFSSFNQNKLPEIFQHWVQALSHKNAKTPYANKKLLYMLYSEGENQNNCSFNKEDLIHIKDLHNVFGVKLLSAIHINDSSQKTLCNAEQVITELMNALEYQDQIIDRAQNNENLTYFSTSIL